MRYSAKILKIDLFIDIRVVSNSNAFLANSYRDSWGTSGCVLAGRPVICSSPFSALIPVVTSVHVFCSNFKDVPSWGS